MLEKTLQAPALNTRRNVLMFLVPSLIGILLFMTPVIYDENVTIPVAVLAKLVQTVFADYLVAMVSAIITTTMLMTLIAWLFKPAILVRRPFLNSLFNVSPFWASVRVLGGVFVLLTFFNAGQRCCVPVLPAVWCCTICCLCCSRCSSSQVCCCLCCWISVCWSLLAP